MKRKNFLLIVWQILWVEGIEKEGVYHYDLKIHAMKHRFFDNILTNTYAFD